MNKLGSQNILQKKEFKRISLSKLLQILVSLCLVFLIFGEQIGLWPSQVLQRLEWISYDERINHTLSHVKDPGVVIVDIDEKSLQTLGQWPWPRQDVAELLIRLFEDYQVQVVGMDVIFAEEERNNLQLYWPELKEAYPELPEQPNILSGDELLGEVLAYYPVVSAFYFEQQGSHSLSPSLGYLPPYLTLEEELANNPERWQSISWIRPNRFTSNNATLQTYATAGGFFDNPLVDSDGVFRRVPLVQLWQEQLYPSLPLAMLYQLFGQPPVHLDIQQGGGLLQLEGIELGGFYIPTDPQAAVLVPWQGPREHFEYISALDILAGDAPLEKLQGHLVLLGTSAPGLMDLRSTPVGGVFPGVEIHANLLSGMLQMNFRSEPGYSLAITVIGLLVIGSLMSLVYPSMKAAFLFVTSLLLLSAHLIANLYAWHQGLVLPLASGLVLIILLSLWHLGMNFWRESQAKKQVAQQFGMYIPPELVADMMKTPEALSMEGQEKELTVLFSDIRGFTSFSEKIPPAELTAVMNRLLTPITEAIHQHQGTIDKYMGDAVMAFWGAPLENSEHASLALKGALAMQAALERINQDFVAEDRPALAMGIGVHTGLMNVGNMGSAFRMAYTVLGDNVNLGARLESITKNYGVKILLSEDTYLKTLENPEQASAFICRPVDYVRVKGRETPVRIYELLAEESTADEDTKRYAKDFEKIIKLYTKQDFLAAQTQIQRYLKHWPEDPLAHLYLERCKSFIKHPPTPDWDGVYTHKTK